MIEELISNVPMRVINIPIGTLTLTHLDFSRFKCTWVFLWNCKSEREREREKFFAQEINRDRHV